MSEEFISQPGQVVIDKIYLYSIANNRIVNLEDYLVELMIYESIFAPFVTGEILLSDSRNLIREMDICGEELLYVSFRTPSLDQSKSISKLFKIYALKDRAFAKDGAVNIYRLEFASIEAFQNLVNPIYKAFEGEPFNIVENIFKTYLQSENFPIGETDIKRDTKSSLLLFGTPTNVLKFVSPGWSPLQNIMFVASRTNSKNNGAASYLFWETTKGFYFVNVGDLKLNYNNLSIGEYTFSMSQIKNLSEQDKAEGKFMFAIRDLTFEKIFDNIESAKKGYLANRLIDIDLLSKSYEYTDYDHMDKFYNYPHMNNESVVPIFNPYTVRNPKIHSRINYIHRNLHTGYIDNFDVKQKEIFGNRRSNILELENLDIKITIPGRTDIEVGRTIKVNVPKDDPGATDRDFNFDPNFSGHYLITSLSHKLNLRTHMITMNITKESMPYTKWGEGGGY